MIDHAVVSPSNVHSVGGSALWLIKPPFWLLLMALAVWVCGGGWLFAKPGVDGFVSAFGLFSTANRRVDQLHHGGRSRLKVSVYCFAWRILTPAPVGRLQSVLLEPWLAY